MIRIIAGKHKGRIVPTEIGAAYRPTTSRFREAMFSILSSGIFAEKQILHNTDMLDLYSGTGSLSFEAISRGVKTSTLVDTDSHSLKKAKLFAEKIGEEGNISFLKCSAFALPKSIKKYNLVVMDPPYKKQLPEKTLTSLIENNWLAESSIIVIESEAKYQISLPNNMEFLTIKTYGNSKLSIISHVKN